MQSLSHFYAQKPQMKPSVLWKTSYLGPTMESEDGCLIDSGDSDLFSTNPGYENSINNAIILQYYNTEFQFFVVGHIFVNVFNILDCGFGFFYTRC